MQALPPPETPGYRLRPAKIVHDELATGDRVLTLPAVRFRPLPQPKSPASCGVFWASPISACRRKQPLARTCSHSASLAETVLRHRTICMASHAARLAERTKVPGLFYAAGGKRSRVYFMLPDQAEKTPGTWLTVSFGPGSRMQQPVFAPRESQTR